MTPEERMLERFTKERQRASKGFAFNIEDEDELTHYGQNLSKLDDFDDVGLSQDEDEDQSGMTYPRLDFDMTRTCPPGQIDSDVVGRTHFGGFGGDEEEASDQVYHFKYGILNF
jgi:nucleolar protein 14